MHPRIAEELAQAIVRLLAERFDLLDKRVAEISHDHLRASELARFRARMFEEANL